MTTRSDRADDRLDRALAALAADAPAPPAALTARVLADAAAVQASLRPAPAHRGRRTGALRRWLAGPGSLAGMATAGLAGLVIGLVEPLPLAALGIETAAQIDLLPDAEAAMLALFEIEAAP
ncbi:MAG: dihydroorotate dehydrogenase [Gemmobacter sp.]